MFLNTVMRSVTGGTDLELIGLDFVNTADVLVRFEWEDQDGRTAEYIDVQGGCGYTRECQCWNGCGQACQLTSV